jgi:NhaP-type Na+/H+ or K+/H+ antiporter
VVAVVVVLAAVLAWVVTSRRLSYLSVTAPLLLMLTGLVFGWGEDPLLELELNTEPVKLVVEVTLALVLFVDASSIGLSFFRTSWRAPARLLGIGLPLTVLLGLLLGLPLFPGVAVVVLAVVASALAPTDAALGASVIEDERIPERIRATVNVESGLNDGLVTPIVLFFVALAAAEDTERSLGTAAVDAVLQIAIAIVIGLVIGRGGGWLLRQAEARGWSLPAQTPIGGMCLALLAYFGAVLLDGNGFVAAFVAGWAFGRALANREDGSEVLDFTHDLGLLLGFVVWFIFGAVLLPEAISGLSWQVGAYALLSLTIIRILPVALAAVGTGTHRDTVLLVGWLGPRGLASIVFAIIAVQELTGEDGVFVASVVGATVALSVLLHGLSAGPLAAWYARRHPADDPTHG